MRKVAQSAGRHRKAANKNEADLATKWPNTPMMPAVPALPKES